MSELWWNSHLPSTGSQPFNRFAQQNPQISLFSHLDTSTNLVLPVTFLEHNGVYYVTDINGGGVLIVEPPFPVTTGAPFFTDIFNACGMAIDSSNNMYVSDYEFGTITKFNIADPSVYDSSWCTGLFQPFSMVIQGDYLYVSQNNFYGEGDPTGTGIIARIYLPDGSPNLTWSTGYTIPSQLVIHNGNRYVSCADGIYSFDILGNPTQITNIVSFLFFPTGLAIYGDYMYQSLSFGESTTIYVFTYPDGELITRHWKYTYNPCINLFTDTSNIYLSTSTFETGTGSILQYGLYDPLSFNGPFGMTGYNGTLYVANYNNGNIVTIDASLNPLSVLINAGLDGPVGLTVDSSGFMYISNNDGEFISKIQISDTSNFEQQWCTGFTNPRGLLIEGTDLYVANGPDICKVSLIDPSGINYTWSSGYSYSTGIAISGTNLYVTDTAASTIYTVPLATGIQTVFITIPGYNPQQLTILGNFMYVDNLNSIDVFNFPDASIAEIGYQIGYFSDSYEIFTYNNKMYITDYTLNEVFEFLPYGEIPCYAKGTKILCEDGYRLIEELVPGDLVQTYLHGNIPIEYIHKGKFKNNTNKWSKCMYRLPTTNPEHDDLIVTGGHGILKRTITKQDVEADSHWFRKNKDSRIDRMYLQRAAFNPDFEQITNDDVYTFYHIALKSENVNRRYGIWANGVLSESVLKKKIRIKAN